jgi:hypothetical protein
MRCARWVVATSMVTGLGACSLTTSLDGLSSGDVVETPGGTDAASPEAAARDGGTETGTGSETGTNADAEAGAASYRAVVLADAPLAYYRLDDQGTTAKDETGAHDGLYKGSVTHGGGGAIAGDTNGAAVFDGSSGYVDVGDVLPFLATAPFTIEAWASPAAGATDPACIASKSYASGGLTGGITEGYTFYLDAGTHATNLLRLRNSTQDGAQGSAVVNGTFSHVVATYDGATLEIWVNGVSVGSGPSARALVSHTKPLTIGASRGGIYCFFRGALDEVAFYGAALSDARIVAHFKAGTGSN